MDESLELLAETWHKASNELQLLAWVAWSERQSTPTLRAFWGLTGYSPRRFTRQQCLRMVRERLHTYRRVFI